MIFTTHDKLILCPENSPENVAIAVKRIESEIKKLFTFEDVQYQLKASIGSAFVPQDGFEPDQILEIADQRMYAVKEFHKQLQQS